MFSLIFFVQGGPLFCMTRLIHSFILQAGIIGLTKAMAVDESKNGVRVNWWVKYYTCPHRQFILIAGAEVL